MEKYSFEEFKLFYETTEKVTERRLAMNKLNYSISITMLAALAIIWKWSISNSAYYAMGIAIILLLSAFSFIFSRNWLKLIEDYKNLNSAKFNVLNTMGKNLFFVDSDDKTEIVSANPFDKEWEIMRSRGYLQKTKKGEYYLKSNKLERFLPRAFAYIFLSICIVSLFIIALNYNAFWEGVKSLFLIK